MDSDSAIPDRESQARPPSFTWTQRYVLTGEIARFSFTASTMRDDGMHGHLWHIGENVRSEIESEMLRVTRAALGRQFELQEIQFERGSIHIHAVLVAVEAVYVTVAHYHHFTKSIDLLVRTLRSIISRLLGQQHPMHVSVIGAWVPMPALAIPRERPQRSPHRATSLSFTSFSATRL